MLLGFHESVFHFCLLETTYVICVKCCCCIPIDSTPFAQFFLLKVNGNLVIYSPPIHTGDLLVTVHNLQQKIQKKEKHGFHLQSMGLSRFLNLFLLQTLSVKSGRDQKKLWTRMKIDPSPTCIKILLYFDGSLSERVKYSKVFSLYLKAPPCMEGAFINWRDLMACDMQSFCSSSKRPFILFFTGEVLFPRASSSFRFQGLGFQVSSPILTKQVSHQKNPTTLENSWEVCTCCDLDQKCETCFVLFSWYRATLNY